MAEYIKREDAIKFFEEKCEFIASLMVNKIPSADVAEVRHGNWYTKSLTRRGGHGEAYFVYGCSVCKKKVRYKTDFCPNCGADMRSNAQVMPSKDGGT